MFVFSSALRGGRGRGGGGRVDWVVGSRVPRLGPRRGYAKTVQDVLKSGKSGEKVEVFGWVKTVRKQKGNTFIEVNDGTSFHNLQICQDSAIERGDITTGACIGVLGDLVDVPHRKQLKEVQNPVISVLGPCDNSYPIHKQGLPVEYLRENAHFRSRTNLFSSIFRVRNSAMMAIHHYFQERQFVNIHTPILTANDCEGAGELFKVTTNVKTEQQEMDEKSQEKALKLKDFFDTEGVYLSVSGQLQAEIFASSLSRVYTFGPTFRAEKSPTPRHLSEFWMVEPEVAFMDLPQILDLAEKMIFYVVKDLYQKNPLELQFFNDWVDKDLNATLKPLLEEQPFERVSYKDALEILQRNGMNIKWGEDLQREHEKYLCETHFKKGVFVINWPASLKPFYMKLNDDKETVSNFDLLVPNIGEIIGGSVREERLDVLEQRMKELNMNATNYKWYLDLRTYGSAPHAGFGLGFERLLQFVSGLRNIRDVIPLPRYPGYCKF